MTEKNSPKHILFITRSYGLAAGGMERLSWELVHSFQSRSDVTIDVLAHETRPDDSLTTVRLRSILFILSVWWKALRMSRTADVVHIGDPVLSAVGFFVRAIYRKPVAVTVHGLDVTYANPLYKLYLWMFFRSFDAYIPISKHAASGLEVWNVSGHVAVIPPGVYDRIYDPTISRETLDAALGIRTHKKVVICTISRLVQRKGHEWFIRNVLPRLPEHAVYAIVGQGPEEDAIRNAIQETHMQDRVFMVGRVPEKIRNIFYNTADIFILPNIPVKNDAEGFGIVLTEAALCKRNVFASGIDGIPDAIHNKRNGTLLPPQDPNAWIEALSHAIYHSQRTQPQARTYTLETFSWDTLSDRYMEVFTQIFLQRASQDE